MKVDREWLTKASTVSLKHEYEDDIDWRKEFDGNPDTIRWIEGQLAQGNEWAWCRVRVMVSFQGFEETEHLGGCAYESEEDFKKGGYYVDMVGECVDKIAEAFEKLVETHSLWQHEKKTCIECLADS